MKNVEPEIKKSHYLPIPFEYDPSKYRGKQSTDNRKSDKKNISLTTNHLYVNFTPAERLKLHEYAISQSKTLGFEHATQSFQYQENGII